MSKAKYYWGAESTRTKGEVELAIADFCVEALESARAGMVRYEDREYVIRVTAELVRVPGAKRCKKK